MAEWNRCDECGRFVGMEDLASGAAKRTFVHPDTEFTAEKWENLCRRCYATVEPGSPNG